MKELKHIYKWLMPGMKIKRWILLSWLGLIFFSMGFILLVNLKTPLDIEYDTIGFIKEMTGITIPSIWFEWFLIILGILLLIIGILKWFKSIYDAVVPYKKKALVDMVYDRRLLDQGIKILAIGGGTGLSSLLRGLKRYTANITAVVTVADDGGSSGKLREEIGIIPPGDIRNCLVALADEENLMSSLFQYRFSDGESLEGHSFGNLFIAAMTDISGDFDKAVKQSSKILNIKGRVLPATLCPLTLMAVMEDGNIVEGESNISHDDRKIEKVFAKPEDSVPPQEVIDAIYEADLIILGPGSLYTSVIPNLLVKGIVEAISKSRAITLYACNVMTQPGETDGYKASNHIEAIKKHAPGIRIDYCLVNDEIPSPSILKKYKLEGADPVKADVIKIEEIGPRPITASLISETNLVRHDSDKLAARIMKMFEEAANLPKV